MGFGFTVLNGNSYKSVTTLAPYRRSRIQDATLCSPLRARTLRYVFTIDSTSFTFLVGIIACNNSRDEDNEIKKYCKQIL